MADKVTLRWHAVQNIEALPDGYRLEISGGTWRAATSSRPGPVRRGVVFGPVQKAGLDILNNQIDIGVRVELPQGLRAHYGRRYESKLLYRTKQYGDTVRTFCMNPYGHVVTENVDGLMTVNGHSYSDPALRSDNTNFALLVSNRFTEPFKEPYRYGKHIASLSNMLSGGVLIQRFGDLLKGTRTNEHRLSKSFVKPTLQATPGDLSLVLPKRHMDNIIEMLFALDKIAPGTPTTTRSVRRRGQILFLASAVTSSLETNLPNFYAIGDGAGITRGLAQARASGVIAARAVHDKMEAID
jgi:uncharacterized FAD-dependent dehydrogenase